MGSKSKIEWTDSTWSPFRARNLASRKMGHFCVHKSAACANCYAEALQARFGNPVRFHAADGAGYRFWAERMREIDPRNPEVAARLAGAVTHFRRYDDARREGMAAAMEEVLALPGLSKNSREVLTRALGSGTRP